MVPTQRSSLSLQHSSALLEFHPSRILMQLGTILAELLTCIALTRGPFAHDCCVGQQLAAPQWILGLVVLRYVGFEGLNMLQMLTYSPDISLRRE